MTRPLESGFNLIEVLVAIVVFAIGMMALAQFQSDLTRSNAAAINRSIVTSIAEEMLEEQHAFRSMGSYAVSDPLYGYATYEDLGKDWAACPETNRLTDTSVCRTSNVYLDDALFEECDLNTCLDRGQPMTLGVVEMVTDYYHDHDNNQADSDGFSTTNTLEKYYSDFKVYTVQITWAQPGMPGWWLSDSQSLTADAVGTDVITVSSIFKSAAAQTAAMSVVTETNNNQISPLKDYTPGLRPDVVALSLGDDRLKEALTPLPDVTSVGEYVETDFDVITYAQTLGDSVFLRLENFKSVTCQCVLGDAAGSLTGSGRRPTVWAADEYEEGAIVQKVVGSESVKNQSPYCDICCRDHHDSATDTSAGEDANDDGRYQYNPWLPTTAYNSGGNHKHYGRSPSGGLTEALAAGDLYEESCRMVRVDGYWRLAHDFRREGLFAFGRDFFLSDSKVGAYTTYVTDSVTDLVQAIDTTSEYYYATTQNELAAPAAGVVPAQTTLPTFDAQTEQQLSSRGIYLDFMSAELREVLECLDSERNLAGGSVASCSGCESAPVGGSCLVGNSIKLDVIGSDNFLEAVPFFEVQMTKLNRWNESPAGAPVDVTNEALADNNAHSRGKAYQTGGYGTAVVTTASHTGNIGFTDTDPIDPLYSSNLSSTTINVISSDTVPHPPPGTNLVEGTIASAVGGVQASKVEITPTDATCNRTSTGYKCWLTGPNPTLKFTGYFKKNINLYACHVTSPVGGPIMSSTVVTPDPENSPFLTETTFDLSGADSTGLYMNDIVIKDTAC